jgi:adenine specific DNA methylase Mod
MPTRRSPGNPKAHEPTDQDGQIHKLVRVAGNTDTLRIIQGDNLKALRILGHEMRSQVTLVYLDPPFFTMRQHERVVRQPSRSGPPVRLLTPAFDDRWTNLEQYLSALRVRLEGLREILAPHGSVFVHVDPRTSHYIKVMGDEIFGAECFASEVIWRYRRWPSRTPNFQRMHDVLLRWVRDSAVRPRFVQLFEELAPSTVKTWGKSKQLAVFDGTGRRRRSSTTTQDSPGAPLGDVWEIPIVAPVARERTGYPTQKPEALMDRIIRSCSHPGDIVVDPYMGSGTTLAVAAKLGRVAIGIDASPTAVGVTRARLQIAELPFSEYAVVETRETALETGTQRARTRVS